LHDGVHRDAVAHRWVERFREASGLPVGGWGVLRTEPEREAELAHAALTQHALEFYVANAELEYLYSGAAGPDAERFGRSRRFVAAFRAHRPTMPAALTSYCRADRHDLDWAAWAESAFVFAPQAYVNDFGTAAAPAACVAGARRFFPASAVHPLIGVHVGKAGRPSMSQYAELLERAGVRGFALYPAEVVTREEWLALGAAVDELELAD
jgi:hypothetical protein